VVEEVEDDWVKVDLKAALTVKAENRPKWLVKACKMAEEGRASKTELYSIINSRKFLSGLKKGMLHRLREVVRDNLELFSDKQQRHLGSDEWALNMTLDGKAVEQPEEADEEEALVEPTERTDPAAPSAVKVSPQPLDDDRARRKREAAQAFAQADDEGNGQTWVTVNPTRGSEDRVRREQKLTEERARRKEKEREKEERWLRLEAEAASKKSAEQEKAKKQQLEDEADSSMMLLESLGMGGQQEPPSRRERSEDRKRRGHSRSISVQRSRSRDRRRKEKGRRGSGGAASREDFDNALKRRMQERERNDTTRIPVVDPDHARRWSS